MYPDISKKLTRVYVISERPLTKEEYKVMDSLYIKYVEYNADLFSNRPLSEFTDYQVVFLDTTIPGCLDYVKSSICMDTLKTSTDDFYLGASIPAFLKGIVNHKVDSLNIMAANSDQWYIKLLKLDQETDDTPPPFLTRLFVCFQATARLVR